MAVGDIGRRLKTKLRTVTWREGTNAVLRSRFAKVRVLVDREDGAERTQECC
jgi:hypothetical protein